MGQAKMSSPNFFDFATYVSSLSIDQKLDELLRAQEDQSPHQREYNRECDEINAFVQKVIIDGSVKKIVQSAGYLSQLAQCLDVAFLDKVKLLFQRRDVPGVEVFGLCFLYTLDAELMEAPAAILMIRDVFLNRALGKADLWEVLDCCKEYIQFMHDLTEALRGHLLEHCKATGSQQTSSDDRLFEDLNLTIMGKSFAITHPSQIYPILDFARMSLTSCCDAQAKASLVAEVPTPQNIVPSDVVGDPTGEVIKGVLFAVFPKLFEVVVPPVESRSLTSEVPAGDFDVPSLRVQGRPTDVRRPQSGVRSGVGKGKVRASVPVKKLVVQLSIVGGVMLAAALAVIGIGVVFGLSDLPVDKKERPAFDVN